MAYATRQIAPVSVLSDLRIATRGHHEALESRFDAIAELSDDLRRPLAIQRYAQFYTSAHAALYTFLTNVQDLSFAVRAKNWLTLRPFVAADPGFGLTRPENCAEVAEAMSVRR